MAHQLLKMLITVYVNGDRHYFISNLQESKESRLLDAANLKITSSLEQITNNVFLRVLGFSSGWEKLLV